MKDGKGAIEGQCLTIPAIAVDHRMRDKRRHLEHGEIIMSKVCPGHNTLGEVSRSHRQYEGTHFEERQGRIPGGPYTESILRTNCGMYHKIASSRIEILYRTTDPTLQPAYDAFTKEVVTLRLHCAETKDIWIYL